MKHVIKSIAQEDEHIEETTNQHPVRCNPSQGLDEVLLEIEPGQQHHSCKAAQVPAKAEAYDTISVSNHHTE